MMMPIFFSFLLISRISCITLSCGEEFGYWLVGDCDGERVEGMPCHHHCRKKYVQICWSEKS